MTLSLRPNTARAESWKECQRGKGEGGREGYRDVAGEDEILDIEEHTVQLPEIHEIWVVEDTSLVPGRAEWEAAEGIVD